MESSNQRIQLEIIVFYNAGYDRRSQLEFTIRDYNKTLQSEATIRSYCSLQSEVTIRRYNRRITED